MRMSVVFAATGRPQKCDKLPLRNIEVERALDDAQLRKVFGNGVKLQIWNWRKHHYKYLDISDAPREKSGRSQAR